MATTDYDFTVTRTEIIERAFRVMGVLSPGQSLGGNETEQARVALNSMVAVWQSDHVFLWTQQQITIPLVDSTQTYAFEDDPQVLSVDQAYLRRASGGVNTDTELDIFSWADFQSEPNKGKTGDPVYVVPTYSTTSGTLYTYPTVSDATNKSLFLFCTVKLRDFDLSTASPDFRSPWFNALVYGLAADLCDEYTLSMSERDRISNKAQIFYRAAKKTDQLRPDLLCVRSAYD